MAQTTPNRGYTYPDEYSDDWYATFAALMNAIDADMQRAVVYTPTTDITIVKDSPAVRFQGQEGAAVEFRIVESAGSLLIQKNTGTALLPVWANLIGFTSGGDLQFFKAGKGAAFMTPDGLNTVRVGIDNDGAIKDTVFL